MNNKESQEKQLDLELKYSRLEALYKFKRFSKEIEKTFTVLPFWSNGIIWAAIISIATTCVLIMLMNMSYYHKLPPQIPFIYNIPKAEWQAVPKIFIWAVPFILGLLGAINLHFLRKAYYMNKNMALTICIFLVIASFLIVFSVNEIFIISII